MTILKILITVLCLFGLSAKGQDKKLSTTLFEGTIVAGYIDKGAYINCTGPAVKFTKPTYSVLLGLLPSIKIKEDRATVKNSIFTPTLGFGATIIVSKKFAIQIPTFYTPKTATTDGKWKLGAGIGYKL
ncbi:MULTISPECIES: hypothetical protein [Sphingobacterium]|uniref:hypothetical protein n=1 Tax=Sphingobacterium TaxID=28453 RepID=UPI00211DB592|nr:MULTISPECIES: hypothetical protein [Sphingobacterium]MCT1530851.1 hypothetical protein [Sphingobacterium daejeonense]